MTTSPPAVRYSPDEDESLSSAVITALAEAKERDPTELECVLYESIDPDVLETVCRGDGHGEFLAEIEFTVCEERVRVRSNRGTTIEIEDRR